MSVQENCIPESLKNNKILLMTIRDFCEASSIKPHLVERIANSFFMEARASIIGEIFLLPSMQRGSRQDGPRISNLGDKSTKAIMTALNNIGISYEPKIFSNLPALIGPDPLEIKREKVKRLFQIHPESEPPTIQQVKTLIEQIQQKVTPALTVEDVPSISKVIDSNTTNDIDAGFALSDQMIAALNKEQITPEQIEQLHRLFNQAQTIMLVKGKVPKLKL